MEKIKGHRQGRIRSWLRNLSLKSAFVLYMLVFLGIGLLLGSLFSSAVANLEFEVVLRYGEQAGIPEDMGFQYYNSQGILWEDGTYQLYSGADSLLLQAANLISSLGPPAVFLLFAMLAGRLFYRRRLKGAIALLTASAGRIAENDLDFQISYDRRDEMGSLCEAFETMRSELERSSREAWRIMEERRQLNAAFAHDLRTPLTVLKGRAQLLEEYAARDGLSPERVSAAARKMSAQVERLEHFTEGMSSLQRLEDLELCPAEVDFEPCCAGLREEAELLCLERGISLSWRQETGRRLLRLDTDRVDAVYENLLSNALRYAGSKLEISWLLSREGLLLLTVTDDGPGFSPEGLQRAFEPFYREEKESGEHFGLGLNLCKILCEKHGGSLRAANAPGGGAMVQASFSVL